MPNMEEWDISELAAPLRGYTYPTESGHQLVTEALPASEAHIGSLPDTVYTVSAFRFR